MVKRVAGAVALLVALTACSGSTEAPTSEGDGSLAGSSGSGATGAAGSIEVQGSLVTSGAYDATWVWEPGNAAVTGPLGGITLTSDRDTFASITVLNDGTFTFQSGQVPEIGLGLSGTAAEVALDDQNIVVCRFTVDTDLAGAPGGALHLAGTMSFVGSDGAVTC
jgi:hypothetical protein